MLQMIERAQARGLDITTEAYPYDAGMTEIQSANLDEYQGASDERLAVLEWPRTGERLNRESFQRYRKTGGPVIIHTNTQEMVDCRDQQPAHDDRERLILGERHGPSPHDGYVFEGAGPLRPRGTVAHADGRDSKDDADAGPAALQSQVPAMKAKGRLRVGADADVTIFDAATVVDRSTYREPALPPIGIQYVIVNGVPVVEKGQAVEGKTPGLPVRARQ